MTLADIANRRLINQQIVSTKFKTAKDIVGCMGAMQAQDYYMSRWAIGARLPKLTDKKLQTAIDKGEIIRTHLLRPTWHFVSNEDVHWMLDLTAPRIRAAMKTRNKQLELTDKLFKKTNTLLQKALKGNNYLTRDELVSQLVKAKIATDDNRVSHIFAWAELEKLICNGPAKGKKQTYALLEEWVPETKLPGREEALEKLARKYFTSHGPATLQDFAWWSGLSNTDARAGLESVKAELVGETVGSEKHFFTNAVSRWRVKNPSVFLLPAYDEFIISYKDRTASLVAEHFKKTVTINGIFKPVIVIDGQVTGLWKRTITNDKIIIEPDFFKPHKKTVLETIEEAAKKFGKFLDKEVSVKFPNS